MSHEHLKEQPVCPPRVLECIDDMNFFMRSPKFRDHHAVVGVAIELLLEHEIPALDVFEAGLREQDSDFYCFAVPPKNCPKGYKLVYPKGIEHEEGSTPKYGLEVVVGRKRASRMLVELEINEAKNRERLKKTNGILIPIITN